MKIPLIAAAAVVGGGCCPQAEAFVPTSSKISSAAVGRSHAGSSMLRFAEAASAAHRHHQPASARRRRSVPSALSMKSQATRVKADVSLSIDAYRVYDVMMFASFFAPLSSACVSASQQQSASSPHLPPPSHGSSADEK